MKNSKRLPCLLIITFLTIFSAILHAQSTDTLQPKNPRMAFYFTGSYLVFYAVGNANVQYLLWDNPGYDFNRIWIKAGGGIWRKSWDHSEGGYSASLEMATMTGTGKHHFEFCAGASFLYNTVEYDWRLEEWEYEEWEYLDLNGEPRNAAPPDKKSYRRFLPSGSIGYRFQKPGDDVVFRCGLGYPDAVYFSFGFCF